MDPRTTSQVKYNSQVQAQAQAQAQAYMMSPDCAHMQPQPATALHNMAPMQDLQDMQESLNRSVTVVFWYKAGSEPIRLHQQVHTFPLFQLSQCSQIINELGFNASSFVDMYNPISAAWEQQVISAVRIVDSKQRVLYRVRKSLLEGLTPEECPGVQQEIAMQQRVIENMRCLSPRSSVKRSAPEPNAFHDNSHPNKYVRMDGMDAGGGSVPPESVSPTRVDPHNRGYAQLMSVQMQNPGVDVQQQQQHTYNMPHQTQVDSQPQPVNHASNASPTLESNADPDAARSPIPYHPHPPLKRWPNDYCVSEIAAGLRQMDEMIAQQPSITQKVAFERVFGCRYIKSTVCRHRAVWKRADQATKDAYESMGLAEHAVWGDFVKKAEGKPSKEPAHRRQSQSQSQQQTTIHHPQPMALMAGGVQNGVPMGSQHGGLDVNGNGVGRRMDDEPVMASLGPPPPGHPGPGSLHPGIFA